jgi:hypothetical protein
LYGADMCLQRYLTELRGLDKSVESDTTEWL